MSSRTTVQDEIYKAIEPYTSSNILPPFSAGELATMAVLCSENRHLNKCGILTWICNTFPAYNQRAISAYANSQDRDNHHHPPRVEEVVFGFHGCFGDSEIPVKNSAELLPVTRDNAHKTEMFVRVKHGRLFLQNVLRPKTSGSVSFLELPPEIRNTIYEMIFTYPKSGLLVTRDFATNRLSFGVLERKTDPTPSITTWPQYFRKEHSTRLSYPVLPHAESFFALLLVNKQIYAEALPIFYNNNHFHFEMIGHFNSCHLHRMPPSRGEYLSDIFIDLSVVANCPWEPRAGVEDFVDNMRALTSIKALKRLQINIHSEQEWLILGVRARESLGRKSKFIKFEHIPGFTDLAKVAMCAEVLQFHGDCKGVESFIKAEIEKMKSEAKGSSKLKKRGRGKKRVDKGGEEAESVDLADGAPAKKRLKAKH